MTERVPARIASRAVRSTLLPRLKRIVTAAASVSLNVTRAPRATARSFTPEITGAVRSEAAEALGAGVVRSESPVAGGRTVGTGAAVEVAVAVAVAVAVDVAVLVAVAGGVGVGVRDGPVT